MKELVRTNDAVMISYIEALLRDAGINTFTADQNMSIVEGSLGILPRRIMVEESQFDKAVELMRDAGIEKELREK